MASSSDCSLWAAVVTNAEAWPASARKRDKDKAAEVQKTRRASTAEGGDDLATAVEEEDGGIDKGGRRKRRRLEEGLRDDGLGVGRGEGERRKEVVSAAIAIGHRLSSSCDSNRKEGQVINHRMQEGWVASALRQSSPPQFYN